MPDQTGLAVVDETWKPQGEPPEEIAIAGDAQALVDGKEPRVAALGHVADAWRLNNWKYSKGVPVSSRSSATFRGNKAALPSKPCVACGRTMTWRKRWARNWAEVKYCSDACRRARAARG